AVIGPIAVLDHGVSRAENQPMRSPGMLERHYAPKAKLICIKTDCETTIRQLLASEKRIGWLRLHGSPLELTAAEGTIKVVDMPDNAASYAAELYAALHMLDDSNLDCIVVDLPPTGDAWMAIHDRLRRAAHQE